MLPIADREEQLGDALAAAEAQIKRLKAALRQIELNTRTGTPVIQKINEIARNAINR